MLLELAQPEQSAGEPVQVQWIDKVHPLGVPEEVVEGEAAHAAERTQRDIHVEESGM